MKLSTKTRYGVRAVFDIAYHNAGRPTQARDIAREEMKSTGMFYAMLPWLSDDLSRAEAVMGPNMWPYGVTSNRKELEAMLRWSFEQGLAPRQGTVEELFAPGLTEARWETGHSL